MKKELILQSESHLITSEGNVTRIRFLNNHIVSLLNLALDMQTISMQTPFLLTDVFEKSLFDFSEVEKVESEFIKEFIKLFEVFVNDGSSIELSGLNENLQKSFGVSTQTVNFQALLSCSAV